MTSTPQSPSTSSSPSPSRTTSRDPRDTSRHDAPPSGQPDTFDGIEDRVESGFRSFKGLGRRGRKAPPLQQWTVKNEPYYQYICDVVAAGWTNLRPLQDYMRQDVRATDEVVSVVDFTADGKQNHPDMSSSLELKNFMASNKRSADTVRLYMAEVDNTVSPELIETLGSGLGLDPRFFQWCMHSRGHIFTPSQRHRAPYFSLGCGVLNAATIEATDVEKFKVLIYIQREMMTAGIGWTGLVLFNSRTKIDVSIELLHDPPPFPNSLPPTNCIPKSFRELYIQSFDFLDLESAVTSPFYLVSNLFRLHCFCWNQVITTIREEDARLGGISDTTIGHAEEIRKALGVVERGGSYGWHGGDDEATRTRQDELKEDYQHLIDQTRLLWETRDKMAAIRKRNADTRWNGLTNAFTYLFAPVTIMTGVYGMNVSQISGTDSNPNIWQFFVAVAAFNVVVLLALSVSTWIQILKRHGRKAHWWEVLGYSVGRVDSK